MVRLVSIIFLPALGLPLQQSAADKVQEALAHFGYEPSCSEVAEKAVEIAGKSKKMKIPSTASVRASALLPIFRFSITKNLEYDESLSVVEEDDSALKIYTDDDLRMKFTLQWDLASLVFNSSENPAIAREQAEAKQQLKLKEAVVELYHARRKLQVLLLVAGGELPLETVVEWTLKVEELTSLLDAMTGGWLGKEVEKRKKEKEEGM